MQAKDQGTGDAHPVGLFDAVKVHHAQRDAHEEADDHADEDGDAGQPAGAEAFNEEDEQQHAHGDTNIEARTVGAVGFCGGGAAYPVRRHRHERETDDEQHGPRHQGREEAQQAGEEWREKDDEEPGADDGTVDGAQPVLAADGDHGDGGGEGAALDEGEADAEAPDADGLHDGGDAGDEEVRGDEVRDVAGIHFSGLDQCGSHEERDGDGTGVAGEDVLEAQDEELPEPRVGVDIGVHGGVVSGVGADDTRLAGGRRGCWLGAHGC